MKRILVYSVRAEMRRQSFASFDLRRECALWATQFFTTLHRSINGDDNNYESEDLIKGSCEDSGIRHREAEMFYFCIDFVCKTNKYIKLVK